VRQLLVESLVLAGVGAVVGLVVAAWGSRALVAQLSDNLSRVFLDLSLDWRVMAFTAGLTVATALFFGAAPAFAATCVTPIDALNTQGRDGSDHARAGLSAGLVIVQMALAIMLVVGAGLLVRTFERLARVPLGFDSGRVLVVHVDASRAHIAPANRIGFYNQLVGAVAAVPRVASAAVSMVTPAGGAGMIEMVDVPGSAPMSERERTVRLNYITPGWFATYGIPIRAGRDLDDGDTQGAPRVFLVNAAFVRKFFPDRNAIGRTVANAVRDRGQTQVLKTVVGVVDDAVYRSVRDGVQPMVYAPLAQLRSTPGNISVSVRSSAGSPAALARSVAAALTAVDRDLAFSFRSVADQVGASFAQERLVATLSGFFGALAVLLAGLGLYGVTSYAVSRRRNEIGIRMALGARRSDVLRLVLGRSLMMTALGLAAGLAGAAAVTRYLEGMLFGVTPLDPTTFVSVAMLFAVVTTIGAFVPARRATTIDPVVALRCE
jgi:predicted permease